MRLFRLLSSFCFVPLWQPGLLTTAPSVIQTPAMSIHAIVQPTYSSVHIERVKIGVAYIDNGYRLQIDDDFYWISARDWPHQRIDTIPVRPMSPIGRRIWPGPSPLPRNDQTIVARVLEFFESNVTFSEEASGAEGFLEVTYQDGGVRITFGGYTFILPSNGIRGDLSRDTLNTLRFLAFLPWWVVRDTRERARTIFASFDGRTHSGFFKSFWRKFNPIWTQLVLLEQHVAIEESLLINQLASVEEKTKRGEKSGFLTVHNEIVDRLFMDSRKLYEKSVHDGLGLGRTKSRILFEETPYGVLLATGMRIHQRAAAGAAIDPRLMNRFQSLLRETMKHEGIYANPLGTTSFTWLMSYLLCSQYNPPDFLVDAAVGFGQWPLDDRDAMIAFQLLQQALHRITDPAGEVVDYQLADELFNQALDSVEAWPNSPYAPQLRLAVVMALLSFETVTIQKRSLAFGIERLIEWVRDVQNQEVRVSVPLAMLRSMIGTEWRHVKTSRPIDEVLRSPWSNQIDMRVIADFLRGHHGSIILRPPFQKALFPPDSSTTYGVYEDLIAKIRLWNVSERSPRKKHRNGLPTNSSSA